MDNIVKQPYEKPEIQVIDINFESSLLVSSGGGSTPPMGKNIPLG